MKRSPLFVALFVLCAASARAQMEMPKPGPELKKLDYFVGTWVSDGDMKPGPMGPGGKVSMTEHSEWMAGGFFVQVHSEFKTPMGDGTGIAFMGYSPDDKGYTYDEFNSMGEAEHSKGSVDGDTWTWTNDEKMGGQTIHGRFTVKILTPSSYSFKFEVSSDGATWSTVMEGKATKKS